MTFHTHFRTCQGIGSHCCITIDIIYSEIAGNPTVPMQAVAAGILQANHEGTWLNKAQATHFCLRAVIKSHSATRYHGKVFKLVGFACTAFPCSSANLSMPVVQAAEIAAVHTISKGGLRLHALLGFNQLCRWKCTSHNLAYQLSPVELLMKKHTPIFTTHQKWQSYSHDVKHEFWFIVKSHKKNSFLNIILSRKLAVTLATITTLHYFAIMRPEEAAWGHVC